MRIALYKKPVIWVILGTILLCTGLSFFLLRGEKDHGAGGQVAAPADLFKSDEIERLEAVGLLDGFDRNTFKYGEALKRSELAVLINRIFKYQARGETTFSDIRVDAAYSEDVYRTVTAGSMSQWSEGRFSPDSPVSRQDFAVTLYKAFSLSVEDEKIIKSYKNTDNIPQKYVKAIYDMVEQKYMIEKPGTAVRAKDHITREEALQTLAGMIGELVNKAGTYNGEYKSNVIINTAGVTLKQVTIDGDLYITAGADNEKITVENSIIKGRVIIGGGGEDGVVLADSTIAGKVVISGKDGEIGVEARGEVSTGEVEVYSGAMLRESQCNGTDGFGPITVIKAEAGQGVRLDGNFPELKIENPGIGARLEGGSVERLDILENAFHSTLTVVKGTVDKMKVAAKSTIILEGGTVTTMNMESGSGGSDVKVGDKAGITDLIAKSYIDVTGKGTIGKASVDASKVVFETKPLKLEVMNGTDVTYQTDESGLTHGIVTGRYYNEMAANPDQFFDDWYNMNLGWIRIEFEEFMESGNKGMKVGYDDASVMKAREKYSAIINKAHEKGIKVLAIVGLNSMPYGTLKPFSEKSIHNYVDAVEWHLRNYAVDAIEIANEPWGYYCSPNKGDLKWYARMMIDTYKKLKPSYSDVVFLAPVSANADQGEWLGWHNWTAPKLEAENSIFNNSAMQKYRDENEGRLPLDAFSWHPYGAGGDPATHEFFWTRDFLTFHDQVTGKSPMILGDSKTVIWFEDIAGRPIVGDYPIWFTEYSWNSKKVGYTNHRNYIESMIQLMKKRPQIKVAFIYTYRDDELTPGTEYNEHGLRKNSRSSFEFKPAYYAFFANSSGVGLRLDTGTAEDSIIKAYVKAGGRGKLGNPYAGADGPDYGVREISGGMVQYFSKNDHKSAVIKKSGLREAYFVEGLAYDYFMAHGLKKTGFPVSDAYTGSEDGYTYQNFEKGKLKWKDGAEQAAFEVVPGGLLPSYNMEIGSREDGTIVGEIVDKYNLFGSEKMGSPVSGADGKVKPLGTFAVIQEFDGGSFGRCALIKKNDKQDVYLIKGEMLEYYKANDGKWELGWPVTDVFEENGVSYQYFQKARLKLENGVVVKETWAELSNKK